MIERFQMTEEDLSEMQAMRFDGIGVMEIAERYGCSASYVLKHTRAPQGKIFDRGKAQALINCGWSIERIALEMGYSKEVIEANTVAAGPRRTWPLEWS